MNRKRFFQLRISRLLWTTLAVAAFFAGRQFPYGGSTQPAAGVVASVPALAPAPLAFDFAVPATTQSVDTKVFSFYVGVQR